MPLIASASRCSIAIMPATTIGYGGAMQVVTTLTNAVLEKLDADTMGMGTTDYNFDLIR